MISAHCAWWNGAEPVSPSTIERFTRRFQPYGFRPEALAPVYGLAENSVGLAFPPAGRLPIIDRIDRQALTEFGLAHTVHPGDQNIAEIVACGQPLPGHEIRIVDDTGREVPDRHQGRLEFRGPSATSGYFQNPEKSEGLFHGDWLDTGDLAYLADGDVYLTGRVKDVIIRAGRNIYPHELEECIGNVEGVRKGCVAETDDASRRELEKNILSEAGSILELPPEEVVLVPPHAVPKTSSGKIRRAFTRELYETGRLGQQDRANWPKLAGLILAGSIGRLRRFARTVAAYAYAAWWWTVLGLLAVAVWPLVVLLPRRAWRHAVLGFAARTLFASTGIRLRVECEAPVPKRDVIFVVNHASYIDGAVLSAAINGPLAFVATERFGRQLIPGPFLRRLGTIFVQTKDAGIHGAEEKALEAVRAGERLVVFPEGRLRRMPGLLSFYPGAFPRRAPITVHIGKPIQPEGEDFDAVLRLKQSARQAILAKNREPDLGREAIDFGISHDG